MQIKLQRTLKNVSFKFSILILQCHRNCEVGCEASVVGTWLGVVKNGYNEKKYFS